MGASLRVFNERLDKAEPVCRFQEDISAKGREGHREMAPAELFNFQLAEGI